MNDEKVYQNERSSFDGRLIGLIGINLLCGFISVITLFIGVPWAIVLKYRWHVSHIKYGGRVLKFDGTGGQLIGSYLLWLLLSIITLGVYLIFMPIKIRQWKIKHTHFASGESVGESKFIGHVFGLLGTNILCGLLILVTLSLALPSAIAIKQAWEANNTIIDGYRLKFTGRGVGLLGSYLKWVLLTIVTFSIYVLWIPLKFENWKVSNTLLVNPLIEKYIEKYSNEWYEDRNTNPLIKARFHNDNRLLAISTIVIASLIIGYNVYLIINVSQNLFNLTDDSFGMLISAMTAYISAICLVLSGIILLLLGCYGLRDSSPKIPFKKGILIFGYSVITLQSLPVVFAVIFLSLLLKGIDSSEVSFLIVSLYSLLNTATLAIDITLIVFFTKNLSNCVSNNNTDNITSHRELSKFGMLAICFAVLSLCASIALSILLEGLIILVLTCLVNTLIALYIYYRTAYALPILFLMSNSRIHIVSNGPVKMSIATTPIIESNNSRINCALEMGYRNLLTGDIDEEKSKIGLKAIEEAIALGSITVYSQLGAYYEDQHEYEKAFESYLEGYEKGSKYAPYFIAKMYQEGHGRIIDLIKAREWHEKAAALGNEASKHVLSTDFFKNNE